MTTPLQVIPVAVRQFFNADSTPMNGGQLQFFVAGTTTPLEVFSDPDQNTSLGTTVDIGAAGYPVSGLGAIVSIFPPLGGYKEVLVDANSNTIYTADNLENVAESYLGTLANVQTEGSKSVTGTYAVVATDNWISSNNATVNLVAAADRGTLLIVQSVGASTTSIVPNGSETINGVSGAYSLAAASSPSFPALMLWSDGVSNWYAIAGS